jgi:heat shock protein HslJ
MTPLWAVAATVSLVGGIVALGGCDSGDESSASENPLFATWVMTSAAKGGEPVTIGPNADVRWQFIKDGPCGDAVPECPAGSKIVGNDGCNTFMRTIEVQRETLTWGSDWYQTAMACSGDMADAIFNTFHADPVRYVVSGDALHLTSADGTVEFAYRSTG